MFVRCLRLAPVIFIHLGCLSLSHAAATNAVIPYKMMDELCQLASGADQTKLLIQVFVASTNKAVQSSDLALTVQSAKAGNLPLTISTNGQILDFPHRKELVRENPSIVANQPKGTLRMFVRSEIPLPDGLVFRYARLGEAATEANRMIKAQAGMMSLLAPDVKGALFVFRKESAGKVRVKILAAAGPKELVADEQGLVKLKLEKSLLVENPEVQISEKPQAVVPDIN